MNKEVILNEEKKLLDNYKSAKEALCDFRKENEHLPKNLEVFLDLTTRKEMIVVKDDKQERYWYYDLEENVDSSWNGRNIGSNSKVFCVLLDKDINYALKKIKRGYVYDRILEHLNCKKYCCKCCCNCKNYERN